MTAARPDVQAVAKYVHVSPRKARLVVDHIRGRSVPEARTILAFTQRAAARDVEKVLRSAVANAETNPNLHWDGDELFVSAAFVDEGPTIKRWRARARGRVNRIHKRTCHITIKVDQLETSSRSGKRPRARPQTQARQAGGRPQRRGEAEDARRRRRWRPNGPEGSSRRPAGRRHPRLEVELDGRQEGVRRRAARGHQDPRAHPQASSRTPASPTS